MSEAKKTFLAYLMLSVIVLLGGWLHGGDFEKNHKEGCWRPTFTSFSRLR